MKQTILTLLCISFFFSCKEKQPEQPDATPSETIKSLDTSMYPQALVQVFKAHGGLDTWSKMENLCFELVKENGNEIHTTSLKNRKAKIEHPDWTIGYNGADVWLQENTVGAYKGNARFYHNLMFYFYAMPFILADDGIQYTAIETTELAGEMYEGIKVSYYDGVGDSPDDEYILFYDPESYQMKWLGYTVTYGKETKSDRWSYIKYAEWQNVNGLQLPEKLTWFTVEDGKPKKERNDRLFKNVTSTETILEDAIFNTPDGAVIVPK